MGFDHYLVKIDKQIPVLANIFPVKSIEEIDEKYILVGTSLYAFKIRISDMQIVDTIWRERCTKVFFYGGVSYIGTLRGLFKVSKDKTYESLGDLRSLALILQVLEVQQLF